MNIWAMKDNFNLPSDCIQVTIDWPRYTEKFKNFSTRLPEESMVNDDVIYFIWCVIVKWWGKLASSIKRHVDTSTFARLLFFFSLSYDGWQFDQISCLGSEVGKRRRKKRKKNHSSVTAGQVRINQMADFFVPQNTHLYREVWIISYWKLSTYLSFQVFIV